MPELSESFLVRQTAPALLAAAATSPHAAESLDSNIDSPWRKWGDEDSIITAAQRESATKAIE